MRSLAFAALLLAGATCVPAFAMPADLIPQARCHADLKAVEGMYAGLGDPRADAYAAKLKGVDRAMTAQMGMRIDTTPQDDKQASAAQADETQQINVSMNAAKSPDAADKALDALTAKLDACKPYLPPGADISMP